MRSPLSKLALSAIIALALALTLSCSDDSGGSTKNYPQSYKYCIKDNICLEGPFTVNNCLDGQLSNSCPDGSSQSEGNSSSSGGNASVSSSSVAASGGSSSSSVGGGSYTEKGNNIANYKTKQIAGQLWMAENLDYNVNGSKCFAEGEDGVSLDSIAKNCATYGRLYDWATAMALPSECNSVLSKRDTDCAIGNPPDYPNIHRGICPSGWHIPTDDDWLVLMKVANPSCSSFTCAGAGKLKATSGWNDYYSDGEYKSGNGTDDFGFTALPGGYVFSFGSSGSLGDIGHWWIANDNSADKAFYIEMSFKNDNVRRDNTRKDNFFSVRCIKD
jgi:uncharacterized protein (TIGR02145 family)